MDAIELLVGVFNLPDQAKASLRAIQKLVKQRRLRLVHSAEIYKDLSGKTHLRDIGDVDAKHGALAGAIVGGLLGLAVGPAGAALGAIAGATTGGVVARKIDLGFSSEFLEELKRGLKPGTSALLVMVETQWSDQVDGAMTSHQGHVLRHALREDLVEKISAAQRED